MPKIQFISHLDCEPAHKFHPQPGFHPDTPAAHLYDCVYEFKKETRRCSVYLFKYPTGVFALRACGQVTGEPTIRGITCSTLIPPKEYMFSGGKVGAYLPGFIYILDRKIPNTLGIDFKDERKLKRAYDKIADWLVYCKLTGTDTFREIFEESTWWGKTNMTEVFYAQLSGS